ncbi:hypothetical protein [Maribacter sp. IgM3_T14_3]|uniref:hypothetical protein n=1 Tax=Maribacter sp. IgM3_T14_3 TaxID=3415140 RepID=UPI003C6EF38A
MNPSIAVPILIAILSGIAWVAIKFPIFYKKIAFQLLFYGSSIMVGIIVSTLFILDSDINNLLYSAENTGNLEILTERLVNFKEEWDGFLSKLSWSIGILAYTQILRLIPLIQDYESIVKEKEKSKELNKVERQNDSN